MAGDGLTRRVIHGLMAVLHPVSIPVRPSNLLCLLLAIVFGGTGGISVTDAASPPNIIIFMVDDLGWNHLSVVGSTQGTAPTVYQTPNLERLAAGGIRFPFAYAQPNCAPTRAAMLSGQYPAREHNGVYAVGSLNRFGKDGITEQQAHFRGPSQQEDVAVEAVTIAEALKKNGYTTAHIGKFHIGGHDSPATLPEQVGFDINIGGCEQGHQPVCFASQQEDRWRFRELGRGDFDRWAEPYCECYLKKRGLPAALAGTPKHISDATGDALVETLGDLAAGGQPFYLQFHTYAVHGPVRARPDLRAVASERAESNRQAEYLGFIAGVDETVGRMLAALEDPNGDGDRADSIRGNTLVLFTSDNGGTHATNWPLRGEKGMFTEGGIRVPLIASWPGHIPAGTVSQRMVHAVDYYPTCLELAGGHWMPPMADHPLDGEPFATELLVPGSDANRGPIGFLFPGYLDSRAQPGAWLIDEVAGERWKVAYDYEADVWSLFCLSEDVGERRDRSAAKPQLLAMLAARLDAWLRQKSPTWHPKYPLRKNTRQPAGPPPLP
jgi:arylsulfatase A-like enzyme